MQKNVLMRKLITNTALFALASALSDGFVNIFIWRLKGNFTLIAWYMISTYIVVPFVFYMCGYIAMRIDRVSIYKTGIFFYLIYYLLILLLNQRVTDFLILTGIVRGIAMGLYFFGYHILTIDFTDSQNRDYFYGTTSLLSGLASIVAPSIAGFIIVKLTGFKGYYAIFVCSILLFIITALMSGAFESGSRIKKPYKIRDLVFSSNKKWRRTMRAYFFITAKDTIAATLIGVLIYKATGNEFTLGKYSTLVAVIGIAAAYIIGKISKPATRGHHILAGAILYFFASFLLIYKIDFITLLFFGMVTAVTDRLIGIPMAAYSMDLISLDANAQERKMEYIVTRDIPVALGRVTILLLFIIFIRFMPLNGIRAILLLVSTFPLIMYFTLYKK